MDIFFVFNKKALLARYFHRIAERPSLFARAAMMMMMRMIMMES
jgi:hypothetical protein